MIVAVPEQQTVWSSGPGFPEHQAVLTWWRWWCSQCRATQPGKASHPEMVLTQGDRHAEQEQCHTEGQLALFALTGGTE